MCADGEVVKVVVVRRQRRKQVIDIHLGVVQSGIIEASEQTYDCCRHHDDANNYKFHQISRAEAAQVHVLRREGALCVHMYMYMNRRVKARSDHDNVLFVRLFVCACVCLFLAL